MSTLSFRHDILPLKNRLYRLALRITLDAADAEDIVQDTLIRVWNKREEWEQLSSPEAYCLTVCRNLALDRSEQRRTRQTERLEEAGPDTTPDSAATPYEALAADEQMALIRRLLDELPEVQRSIMELRDVEGKTYKEIAEVLRLNEDQVRVYLFRARQKIKQRLIKIEEYGL